MFGQSKAMNQAKPKVSSRRLQYLRDLFADVSLELRSQQAKGILLVTAVSLAIGALFSAVGLAQTVAHQVDADLAASTLRVVTVELTEAAKAKDAEKAASGGVSAVDGETFFERSALNLIVELPQVESAGYLLRVTGTVPVTVARSTTLTADGATAPPVEVVGATSGYLAAVGARVEVGDVRILDSEQRNLVFLGTEAADELGMPKTADTTGLVVYVNGVPHSVAGFVNGGAAVARSVFVPYAQAVEMTSSDRTALLYARTALGAGNPVAMVLAQMVSPTTPERYAVSQVVTAHRERHQVTVQLTRQASWVGAFLVVLSSFLIANSMIVAVTSRTVEIGVRRALGSSKLRVANVFLLEGGIVGFLGGLGGGAIAAVVVLFVSFVSGWTALINPLWFVVAPVLGLAVGLVSSAYPALRASRIQPALAVRAA